MAINKPHQENFVGPLNPGAKMHPESRRALRQNDERPFLLFS
jgi:hypothetical protein